MINNILNINQKSAIQSTADAMNKALKAQAAADAEKEKEQNANNTQNMQVSNSNKFDAYLSDEYLSQIADTKNTNEKKMKEEKKYTITIPTGQVLNVNKDAYEELKQWIALYNRCSEFALENGIGIPPWEWVLSKGSRAMPELQQLAEQKRQEDLKIKNINENLQKDAEERAKQEQENTTAPQNNDGVKEEKGSSLLVPGIILVGGILCAILLTKKSKRR